MKTRYWIMKCEPSVYSIDDLERDGEYFWNGVRNYQVRNMFRDLMKAGDQALFYHSSCGEVGVVGEMKILKASEIDQTQFDSKSEYFDVKSTKDNPRWLGPTVGFVKKFKNIITLEKLRSEKGLANLILLKRGNRLSVTEITQKEFETICQLGQ